MFWQEVVEQLEADVLCRAGVTILRGKNPNEVMDVEPVWVKLLDSVVGLRLEIRSTEV